MTVGERIKQVREAKGLSQDELAKRMGYKDRSSISKIEKDNDDNISMNTVQKAAESLGCSPLYLMEWVDDMNYKPDSEPQSSSKVSTQPLTAKEQQFIEAYSRLSEEQQGLVDNLMRTWLSKQ